MDDDKLLSQARAVEKRILQFKQVNTLLFKYYYYCYYLFMLIIIILLRVYNILLLIVSRRFDTKFVFTGQSIVNHEQSII